MPRPRPNPQQYLRRRAIRLRLFLLLAAALLLLLIRLDSLGLLLPRQDDLLNYDRKTFRVAYVVDGDTLDLETPDPPRPTTRIRLWGINAPEIAHPQYNDKPAQPLGPEAEQFTRSLCDKKDVTLHVISQRLRDRSDVRLLAYVTLPDGTSLNERLLAAGLARADDRWPHERAERYALIERQARADRVGMWGMEPVAGDRPPVTSPP